MTAVLWLLEGYPWPEEIVGECICEWFGSVEGFEGCLEPGLSFEGALLERIGVMVQGALLKRF